MWSGLMNKAKEQSLSDGRSDSNDASRFPPEPIKRITVVASSCQRHHHLEMARNKGGKKKHRVDSKGYTILQLNMFFSMQPLSEFFHFDHEEKMGD